MKRNLQGWGKLEGGTTDSAAPSPADSKTRDQANQAHRPSERAKRSESGRCTCLDITEKKEATSKYTISKSMTVGAAGGHCQAVAA